MKNWQIKKLQEIEAIIEKCKTELALNFDCPSEQILGVYGTQLKLDSKQMFEAICRYNERHSASN